MGRVINIDELWKELEILYDAKNGEVSWNDALWKIKRAPVFESNAQQWIPCERELPDVGRSVLISVGGMYTAEGCLREDGDWTQFRWDAIQRKDMVGAWKPIDEPWKGEQE